MTVNDLQKRTYQIDGFYTAQKARKQELISEIDVIKNEIDLLTKTSAVLKHLLDIMVKDEIDKMAGLITYGLKTIFNDQDLTFVPKIIKKNEKTHVELKTLNKGVEGEFGSFGGSVAVIESLFIRLLCILKKKHARFLLLDETFAAVGEEYISNTYKLISELAKKLHLDILLVTQLRSFQDNADHVYKVKESDKGLIMEQMR
jgi:hypothetical protein